MTSTTTNNVPRDIIDPHEMTPGERAQFDYYDWNALDDGRDSASFFRYRGHMYDVADFMLPGAELRAAGWEGCMADSYFSGVVIRFVDDGERVVVGRVMS